MCLILQPTKKREPVHWSAAVVVERTAVTERSRIEGENRKPGAQPKPRREPLNQSAADELERTEFMERSRNMRESR